MDKELSCDFVFGDKMGNVKKMDYSLLSHFKKEVRNKKIIRWPLNYQEGVTGLLDEGYSYFVMLGDYYCLSTWWCLLFRKRHNKKIYLWTHGWYGRESKIKAAIMKYFYSLSDGLFLYGDYAKKLMVKEGIPEEKLAVIYNSLDYDEQLKIRNGLTISEVYSKHFGNNYPVLIFTGRLESNKKLDMLIEAHKRLLDRNIKTNVILLGDGSEKERLEKRVSDLNLNEFYWFYGSCYDEKVIGELYYNATVCISPGNVGLTSIHALTYGCPVITHSSFSHQMPEFEAITPSLTGDFFIENDIGSLSDKIENWLKNNYPKSDVLKNKCYEIIDTKYNPRYQIQVMKDFLL